MNGIDVQPASAIAPAPTLFTHKVSMWTALVVERVRAAATRGEVDIEAIVKDAEHVVEQFEARFEKKPPATPPAST